jgi:hypothetical protein
MRARNSSTTLAALGVFAEILISPETLDTRP